MRRYQIQLFSNLSVQGHMTTALLIKTFDRIFAYSKKVGGERVSSFAIYTYNFDELTD